MFLQVKHASVLSLVDRKLFIKDAQMKASDPVLSIIDSNYLMIEVALTQIRQSSMVFAHHVRRI
jgi:hypothetical protein